MARPLALDAFGCAGLMADGMIAAGFDVVALDVNKAALKYHPAEEKIVGRAEDYLADRGFLRQFSWVHTAPPCQPSTAARELAIAQGRRPGRGQPDLIGPTRELLLANYAGAWTIENVYRSSLRGRPGVVCLCGSAFGLDVERHRLFEPGPGLRLVGTAHQHQRFPVDPRSGKPRPWGVYHSKADDIPEGGRTVSTTDQGHQVMGLTWRQVPWCYLREGVPPLYGLYVGGQVRQALEGTHG